MKTETKGPEIWRWFGSWNEFLDYAQESIDDGTYPESEHASESFAGGTMYEAFKLARKGWAEGVRGIVQVLGRIETSTQEAVQSRWRTKHDVRGGGVNVARMLTDHPRYMRRRVRVQTPVQRAIRIGFAYNYSAGISRESVMQRGAVIAALVDALRRAGRPVYVDALWINCGEDQDVRVVQVVPVSTPGQPLDMGRLAFAAASTMMLRHIGFAAFEKDGRAKRIGKRGHFGYPPRAGHARAEEIGSSYDLFFSPMYFHDKQWSTPEGTAKWIVEKLAGMGIKVQGEAAPAKK